jgi:hypothetical protein
LVITIAAVLSGCDDWNEIELYGNSKEEWLKTFLELPGGIPSHDTFNRVFAMLDLKNFKNDFYPGCKALQLLQMDRGSKH